MTQLVRGCFSAFTDCFYGSGEWSSAAAAAAAANAAAARAVPEVTLDTASMGHEAVVVKNASRLCGTGAARASVPVRQNKAYWEVKVQQAGIWSCGHSIGGAVMLDAITYGQDWMSEAMDVKLANAACSLSDPLGMDSNSWVLTSDNEIKTSSHTEYKLSEPVQEGDVIGFSYDHVELNFFLNGSNVNCPILGIKGTVYPILYVDDGAILDAIFESFRSPMPIGFDRIMVEKALL